MVLLYNTGIISSRKGKSYQRNIKYLIYMAEYCPKTKTANVIKTSAVLDQVGCRTRIRTLTNGVRDRCATVTQFGNAFSNFGIIANRFPKINKLFELRSRKIRKSRKPFRTAP